MLNRLLITWLMMTILGYGMALAADVHNDQMPGSTHSMDMHDTGGHSSHPDHDDAPIHDHCYHGSSHLLGLNSDTHIDFSTEHSSVVSHYSDSITSIPPSRFLRPPRIA